jgi:CheY-like chemotaxis protein
MWVTVLDLELPRLSGRDVRHQRSSRPDTRDVPIVVVTGTDSSDLDPYDFATILRKPITVEALVTAVGNAIRGARLRPAATA